MKRQNNSKKVLPAGIPTVSTIVVLMVLSPVLAETYDGVTTVTFSVNPATLSGDATPDVTITTTTTAPGASQEVIDDGKVTIQLATDGAGNPVPAADVVTWVALNAPGQNPVGGVTTLPVDLEALGFVCDTVAGFQAHYVTGGGKDKVGQHKSDPVDLTAVCECECEVTESAFAYSADLGTCFLDIDADGDGDGDFNRWGWSIGPLAEVRAAIPSTFTPPPANASSTTVCWLAGWTSCTQTAPPPLRMSWIPVGL